MTEKTANYEKRPSLKLLGSMRSNIVGSQYYNTKYKVDDSVHFERNPYNEYDENAIEVSNDKGLLGHVKREQAAWLGALIDEGRIYLKGEIIDEGDNWRIPIRIDAYLTKKGKTIMTPGDEDSPEQVIHNHLLDVFMKSEDYSSETIVGIRDYYRGIIHSDGILPETHLIFKLLKIKACNNRKNDLKEFSKHAKKYLSIVKYGQPVQNEDITVVPLIIEDSRTCRYVSGKKALKDKTLVVEEIGESGQVSRLRATNTGSKPVMLISGEGLKGAKQDRIVNVTVIIEVNETVDIPVSCVERGRWSYGHKTDFEHSNFATESIRMTLRQDVNRNISEGIKSYDSDQDMVWHSVAETATEYDVNSSTENLNEVYKARQSEIEEFIKNIKYVKGAAGIAIFSGRRQISVDLFEHPSLMKENWNDILQSVAVDAGRKNLKSESGKREISEIRKELKEFFSEICSDASAPEASPGTGHYIVSRNEKLEAGTLVVDDTIAHLSGYRKI